MNRTNGNMQSFVLQNSCPAMFTVPVPTLHRNSFSCFGQSIFMIERYKAGRWPFRVMSLR